MNEEYNVNEVEEIEVDNEVESNDENSRFIAGAIAGAVFTLAAGAVVYGVKKLGGFAGKKFLAWKAKKAIDKKKPIEGEAKVTDETKESSEEKKDEE